MAGFHGCSLSPLDCTQVLKKIPGKSHDPGGPESNAVLNDSVMELLRTHCGIGIEPQR